MRNATPPAIRTHYRCSTLSLVTERLTVLQQSILGRSGSIDDLLDGAHGVGADIGLDDLPGSVKTFVLTGIDGAFQLIQLDLDLMFQDRPSALLLGIVRGELLQLREIVGDLLHTLFVGIEIRGVSGDQESALASLGVLNRTFECLGRINDLDGMGNPVLAPSQLRDIPGNFIDLKPNENDGRYEDQDQSLPQGLW